MGLIKPQDTRYWGVFVGAATLPNVVGSPNTDADLLAGDIAFDSVTSQLWLCTAPGVGVAVWVALAAGGGSPFAIMQSAAGAWTVPFASVIGNVVYATGANTAALATNVTPATAPVTGIIIAKPTAVTGTLAYAGEVAIYPPLTFTPGVEYFLGVAGGLTSVAPAAPADVGKVVQSLGRAMNATTLIFCPGEPVNL